METTPTTEVCVIGGGIIGLAIARELSMKGKKVLLLEKESGLGEGVSSRNSGVIHAGLYYPRSFLKTQLCLEGKNQLYGFCEKYQVPFRRCGKIVVAMSDEEHEYLHALMLRAELNGVDDLQMLSRGQLAELEPSIQAKGALLSPSTGVIDVVAYRQALARHCDDQGVDTVLNTSLGRVETTEQGFLLHCADGSSVLAEQLINAAGLNALAVAGMIQDFPAQCMPEMLLLKGSYFVYRGKSPFSHLIYPVPVATQSGQPGGLGIHATLDMEGTLRFGPDAEVVNEINFQVCEKRKAEFVQAVQRYFPDIREEDLSPDYAGIRPRLKTEGNKTADFIVQDSTQHGLDGLVNLFGIESPGLTASLALAELVAKKIL